MTGTTPRSVAVLRCPIRQREPFLDVRHLSANTISPYPSHCNQIQTSPYNYLKINWWTRPDSNRRLTIFLIGSSIILCRSGWNWTNIKGFGDPHSTVKLHSYISPVTYSTGAKSHHPSRSTPTSTVWIPYRHCCQGGIRTHEDYFIIRLLSVSSRSYHRPLGHLTIAERAGLEPTGHLTTPKGLAIPCSTNYAYLSNEFAES